MKNEKVSLYDIKILCEEFAVKFSIETNGKDLATILCFGEKVRWMVPFGEQFQWYDYLEVVKRLSANYPERVLK